MPNPLKCANYADEFEQPQGCFSRHSSRQSYSSSSSTLGWVFGWFNKATEVTGAQNVEQRYRSSRRLGVAQDGAENAALRRPS